MRPWWVALLERGVVVESGIRVRRRTGFCEHLLQRSFPKGREVFEKASNYLSDTLAGSKKGNRWAWTPVRVCVSLWFSKENRRRALILLYGLSRGKRETREELQYYLVVCKRISSNQIQTRTLCLCLVSKTEVRSGLRQCQPSCEDVVTWMNLPWVSVSKSTRKTAKLRRTWDVTGQTGRACAEGKSDIVKSWL